MLRFSIPLLFAAVALAPFDASGESKNSAEKPLRQFVATHCDDCHSGTTKKEGLDLSTLAFDIDKAATFAKWEHIFDRVKGGEMPPKEADQPAKADRVAFTRLLGTALTKAHAKNRGTVLRRLNRREYENTMNDLFGTHLDLADLLPEDGKSHEFDNVGRSLGVSMVHLQRYMEAAGKVFDAAIAKSTTAPKPAVIDATYRNSREAKRFVGRVWKELGDGAIVRFSGGGYPTGMIRGSNVRQRGRYRIKVTGYAYQSDKAITFSVGGTSFRRGSEKPIYGFYSFPSGKPGQTSSIELEAWIDRNYMIAIEPYGISDPNRYRRKSITDYKGPGLAILKVTLTGPLVGEFPSRGHRLVFGDLKRREIPPRNPADRRRRWYKPKFEVVTANESADAMRAITRIATAAFRRPAKVEDVAPYLKLFSQQRSNGSSFEDALRTTTIAIFCSSRFLYLNEPAGQLDDYALAARLSYFFTRTTPDKTLLRLAAARKLADPATLREQAERLLKDPRSDRLIADFTDTWLDLREMDFTMPDRSLFPEFDDYLRWSMPRETRAYLRELFTSNLAVTNLVKSDFAMLNSRLARHYGLPPVTGSKIRKVKLPAGSVRGGFLSQASILKVTANGTNSSPVTRGAWVMERILGETPKPPPPGIPGVEPDIRGATTLRQLLDKHRSLVSCRSCHQKIDPPGFALESFNPIGGYRSRYRSLGKGERVAKTINGRRVRYRLGLNVDSSGQLPDGRKFADFQQFRNDLSNDRKLLARTLTRKLLTFATGRELGFSDRPEIERLVRASAAKGHRIRDLVHLVVGSDIFQSK